METEQLPLHQKRRQLQRMAARKDLLAAKMNSWDGLEHAGEADLQGRQPLGRGWRCLKAVSILAFNGRAAHMMEVESSPMFANDNSLTAAEIDHGVKHPHTRGPDKVQPLLPPGRTSGSNNSVHEVIMDVASSNLPLPNKEIAQVVAVHGPTDDQMKEQQERCLKYSQKALGFAICTLIGYASLQSATRNITFKVAIAPFFIAICADLFSLKTKGKQGNALVYLSSSHLVMMIYLIFISFNMYYAYASLFLPLVACASLLQQKLWPHLQSTDDQASKDLDSIFDLSALILNWSSFIVSIMSIFIRFVHGANGANKSKQIADRCVGFLFLLTIVLGLYLMLVTTVRTVALNLRAKYLDILLICLLLSTLIAAVITITKT